MFIFHRCDFILNILFNSSILSPLSGKKFFPRISREIISWEVIAIVVVVIMAGMIIVVIIFKINNVGIVVIVITINKVTSI